MIKTIFLVVGVLIILGMASNDDIHTEEVDREYYCKMVGTGAWPAYRDDVKC